LQVKHVPGGVGRNIAEGVSRLVSEDRKPAMVSMVGADGAGEHLLAHLRALRYSWTALPHFAAGLETCLDFRVSTEAIAVVEGVASPSVVTVFDRCVCQWRSQILPGLSV
jgi:sugar/nucleoside kinase (ribokinase family)